jgi:hypothetical protein
MRQNNILKLSIILLLTAASILPAQDWDLMNSSRLYNYISPANPGTVFSIFSDSATHSGGDSIYFLNRVVQDDVDGPKVNGIPENAFYNVPQFLMKQITETMSHYVFDGPHHFELLKNPQLNQSWIFDQKNNITATLLSLKDSVLFDQHDSIRIIGLSSGKKLITSKQFGLISFGAIYEKNSYSLSGIDNVAGQQLMDYKAIFDFQPGDVFEYKDDQWGGGWDVYRYIRLTILERTDYPDAIQYRMLYQENRSDTHSYPFTPETRKTGCIELTYSADSDPEAVENGYHGQLISFDEQLTYYGLGSIFTRIVISIDENGRLIKTIGSIEASDFFLMTDTINEVLTRQFFNFDDGGEITIQYAEGLGEIFHETSYFEHGRNKALRAYKKDGITVGTFLRDDFFLAVNETDVSDIIIVYPNPVDDILYLELPAYMKVLKLSVRNMQGQIKKICENPHSIYVGDLNPGIYLLIIQLENDIVYKRFIRN